MPKLLDDVNAAIGKLRSVGGGGAAGLPDQLSEQDKQQAEDAIKQVSVEIYTGADDRMLRRMVVGLELAVPTDAGATAARRQARHAVPGRQRGPGDRGARRRAGRSPSWPRSCSSWGSASSDLGGGSSGSSSGGGSTQQSLDDYAKCIQDAQGDNAKERKCSEALPTP